MAKTIYTGIAGVARKVKQPYVGVAGVARKVKAGYLGVGGVARQFYAGGTPLSSLAVGTSVYITVNSTKTEFIIVQQGRPSSVYDSSCDGTWLLQKTTTSDYFAAHSEQINDYANSNLHNTHLNSTYYSRIISTIRSKIKTVKIPYTNGTGGEGTVASGSSGLSTKIFALSIVEVGESEGYANTEGATLSYFSGASDATRTAYDSNGTARSWWLRSPHTYNYGGTGVYCYWRISDSGYSTSASAVDSHYLRPSFILPSTTLVDDSKNILA